MSPCLKRKWCSHCSSVRVNEWAVKCTRGIFKASTASSIESIYRRTSSTISKSQSQMSADWVSTCTQLPSKGSGVLFETTSRTVLLGRRHWKIQRVLPPFACIVPVLSSLPNVCKGSKDKTDTILDWSRKGHEMKNKTNRNPYTVLVVKDTPGTDVGSPKLNNRIPASLQSWSSKTNAIHPRSPRQAQPPRSAKRCDLTSVTSWMLKY